MPNLLPVVTRKAVASLAFICLTLVSSAQVLNLYNYHELSSFSYASLRDSLKKNWVCPVRYSKKETQQFYKNLWETRTETITSAINDKDYIHDKEIFSYLDNIVAQIYVSNKTMMPGKPLLLIDRNAAVNAYTMGGNIIIVNLGLVSFSKTREEIALVVAHELSHNILDHTEKAMRERAEWFTSDEYKKTVNAVLDSKYERFTRLKNIFEGFSFSRTRHSRYHEQDADSLAIVLLNNSKIPFDAQVFLRLDSADNEYQQKLQQPLSNYFTAYHLPFEQGWTQKRSKGLSSHNYDFAKKDAKLEDSLKTHPDCIDRFKRTNQFTAKSYAPTPVPSSILNKTNRIIIWNVFDNQQLTACLYRILQEKDKSGTDPWLDFMLHNVFAGLSYSDNQLNRFNAINMTTKELVSADYYALQTMLEQMPRDVIDQYCHGLEKEAFWETMPGDAKALKDLFATLTSKDANDKTKEVAAKNFALSNDSSMYCEFADHFYKK